MKNAETPPITTTPSRKPKRRRVILGVLSTLIGLYATVCVYYYVNQDAMIFPGYRTQGAPAADVRETDGTRIIRLTLTDGMPVAARFDPANAADPKTSPTVLLFYGNGNSAASCGGIIYMLQQIGCNVLTPDYPGYGMSGGWASEQNINASADRWWKYLKEEADIDRTQIHILGWSLGGSPAIQLAARADPQSLTTISAFTSLTDMGRQVAPFLPTPWLLNHKFDSLAAIDRVKCPILLIHGEADTFVPATMSKRLADRATARVTTLFLPGASHNIFDADNDKVIGAIRRNIMGEHSL